MKVRVDEGQYALETTDGNEGGDVVWLSALDLAVCIDMFQGR